MSALADVLAEMAGAPGDANIAGIDPGDYMPGLPSPAEFAAEIERRLGAAGYVIAWDWRSAERLEQERRKAAKAARLAAALPYAGELQCQASVPDGGRSPLSHRCQKRARYVVRIKDDRGGRDGRLAVCRVHAADDGVFRYIKHWPYETSADEPVEQEYQP